MLVVSTDDFYLNTKRRHYLSIVSCYVTPCNEIRWWSNCDTQLHMATYKCGVTVGLYGDC